MRVVLRGGYSALSKGFNILKLITNCIQQMAENTIVEPGIQMVNQHPKGLKDSDIEDLSYELLTSSYTALTSALPETFSKIPTGKLQTNSEVVTPYRVRIYRHHPSKNGRERGKLVNLPKTMGYLLQLAGLKFGFHPVKVFNEDGAEIEDINVIRDNDMLFFVDREELEEAFHLKFF